MRVAVFGGSFDPVHIEHVRLVRAAIRELRLDKVIIMPSAQAPHKEQGANAEGTCRLEMCKIAFRNVLQAEVCDDEIRRGGTSYTYLTCLEFAKRFPFAQRFFLVGADMLENFFSWKNPEQILDCVTLAACGRGSERVGELHKKFIERFNKDFWEIPFIGKEVSSTILRVLLAFRRYVMAKGLDLLDPAVLAYLEKERIYSYKQEKALSLEKQSRREHSLRVALMACERARSLHIPEQKVLLAAMLHDCGKNISSEHQYLKGMKVPLEVPDPVLHQYTGAYLAENYFHVCDQDILNAIRYHTSGRAGMSELEKLIYLSDLLEEGRDFEGIAQLRDFFNQDLNLCLKESLSHQIRYLTCENLPIYPLTIQAYQWITDEILKKQH